MKIYPIMYTVVDIAIIDYHHRSILLGQKKSDNGYWRFPGGFADPTDLSFEDAAQRELREEVGGISTLPITPERYKMSQKIFDCRYRESDQICSMLYETYYIRGRAFAQDDLQRVKWFPIKPHILTQILPNHREFFKLICKRYMRVTYENCKLL